MNFLIRSTHHVVAEQVHVSEPPVDASPLTKSTPTLEGLIGEESFPRYSSGDDLDHETDGVGGDNGGIAGHSAKNDSSVVENHTDVSEEEGWITIPYKELPDNWNDAPDIHSLNSLDRSFVFPGEQVHVLACLSACKQDTEIITPFKVAAVMRNSRAQSPDIKNGNLEDRMNAVAGEGEVDPDDQAINQNGEKSAEEKIDLQMEISASESFLRMEDHKRQTETILQKFKNSHFFVRISESDESLWSKKSAPEVSSEPSETDNQKSTTKRTVKSTSSVTAVIDRGNFDANISGGVARDTVTCCSLSNGDIVVLLQVNVGIDFLRDPVIEILQFEKFKENNLSDNQDNLHNTNSDPCGELLKWLLPLDNTVPPPARSLSPPRLNPGSGIGSTSVKSSSAGSQLFSFGHFRSYSMSSLPQNIAPPPIPVKAQSSKPTFDIEDWDQDSSQKLLKGQRTGNEGLLSFRGVSLERERFSVRCGLEGIYVPGRRWRRKLEIIQPVEIHSFSADCNTDDLLCIQIKNVAPAHIPDIVVYIDAITIVFEEASKGGPLSSLPIACIEAGNDHSLPNLALSWLKHEGCIDVLNNGYSVIESGQELILFVEGLLRVYSLLILGLKSFRFLNYRKEKWIRLRGGLLHDIRNVFGSPDLFVPLNLSRIFNLRRGEEHSFILKPVSSMCKNLKVHGERSSRLSTLHLLSKAFEGKRSALTADQYAIMVSCRCNYTESRLFFKQPTTWRPRISRDLMISVASEVSEQSYVPNERVTQLPVQVLTLQASNLTSEDLTLTVLAPTSFTSPPSVVSLSSSPTSPKSPFVGFSDFAGRVNEERRGTPMHRLNSVPLVSENQKHNGDGGVRSVSLNKLSSPKSDVIPSPGLGCTHLWLQSRVPLGCIPSHSTATIKLELLPLTDGIITLDTLQIDVKEKGVTYIPEHSLKINATSSISTGII
ncbi:hypothetical protein JRO89_XS05G0059900 [Xanthoceras sorbifolium]|uniref:Uncharacterized protein n=1 Tax=Xanthoceras sorbifolium TaxID=99658 RepID=A0ABQ8I0R4_9ROSI|nr:hypothetical protein JRO89_XS05G0059900 [Xanthoceras sorbifolium]